MTTKNKPLNKNKLSKKLKLISVASAIVVCSTISSGVYESSATPLRNLCNRFWNSLQQGIRRVRHAGSNIFTFNIGRNTSGGVRTQPTPPSPTPPTPLPEEPKPPTPPPKPPRTFEYDKAKARMMK